MPSSAYFNYSYWEPRTFLVPLGEKEIPSSASSPPQKICLHLLWTKCAVAQNVLGTLVSQLHKGTERRFTTLFIFKPTDTHPVF